MLCLAVVFGLPAKDAAKALKPESITSEQQDLCCLPAGGVIEAVDVEVGDPCLGVGSCLIIMNTSPSCTSNCYICMVDEDYTVQPQACPQGYGIRCADVVCNQQPPALPDTMTVHGDPMFKVNGKGVHFWLKAGELTPLLTSSAITLSGRTFDREDTGCMPTLRSHP